MKIDFYQVDAFTSKIFRGNPAGVCVLTSWLAEQTMQNIAAENNLAETAFVVKNEERYEIRWFTPAVEVDLCGHATLAAAYVLCSFYETTATCIQFWSPRSGCLPVEKHGNLFTMDFPVDQYKVVETPQVLIDAFGIVPQQTCKGKTDYLLLFNTEDEVANCKPDLNLVASVGGRGVIVSAKGKTVDIVSRFFAPQAGIPEDPVTGSSYTTLVPVWSKIFDKTKLSAKQLSARGGDVLCVLDGERVKISGEAALFLKGEIEYLV